MKDKETDLYLPQQKSLISDEYFYKYIFKKTEKIVCAVFFILNIDKDNSKKDKLVQDIESLAITVLDTAVMSLSRPVGKSKTVATELSHGLIQLESKLRVLHAAGVLITDHLNVFVAEIDAALRSLRTYTKDEREGAVSLPRHERTVSLREQRDSQGGDSKKTDSEQVVEEPKGDDRRSRILAVLKAQGEASIKDISDTVTDCSEKTIQRELNSLIKDGIVLRSGERRWSKYSIA